MIYLGTMSALPSLMSSSAMFMNSARRHEALARPDLANGETPDRRSIPLRAPVHNTPICLLRAMVGRAMHLYARSSSRFPAGHRLYCPRRPSQRQDSGSSGSRGPRTAVSSPRHPHAKHAVRFRPTGGRARDRRRRSALPDPFAKGRSRHQSPRRPVRGPSAARGRAAGAHLWRGCLWSEKDGRLVEERNLYEKNGVNRKPNVAEN
jgi:hypothetical protein